jgi:hypothetical protein
MPPKPNPSTETEMQKNMRAQLERSALRPHPVDDVLAKADELRERVAHAERLADAEKGKDAPPPLHKPRKSGKTAGYSMPKEGYDLLEQFVEEAMREVVTTSKSTVLLVALNCMAKKMTKAERVAALRETKPRKPGKKPQVKPGDQG